MTSFGWKKKFTVKVSKEVSSAFESESKDENDDFDDDAVDWLTGTARKRCMLSIEDAAAKSERLKEEGSTLAESERFWEAIKKWDEAMQLTPENEKLYEMKAQALIQLCEVYPAVLAARKVVEMAPRWWVGHQTLGRALLGMGEVHQAVRCFSRAVHIQPDNAELWEDDLRWAQSLLQQKKTLEQEAEQKPAPLPHSSLTITELPDSGGEEPPGEEEGEGEEARTEGEGAAASLRNMVVHMSAVKRPWAAESESSPRSKKLKNLPQNYVLMRDK